MAIPPEIDNASYLSIGSIQIGRPQHPRNYTFHAYLELYEQAKHDKAAQGRCRAARVEFRRTDGTQVSYRDETFEQFYSARARVICARVATYITEKLGAPSLGNAPVFVRGATNKMAIQKERQTDKYQYDVCFWHDGGDTYYVSFHCYPPKR